MNETAKKLRDITQNMRVTPGSSKPYSVIATIKCAFGFDSISAAGVLLQFMAAIADEMDELQAKANDANNLRQKLESAEKKAKCRKTHIWSLNDALRDKNDMLKQRGLAISRLTTDNSELRKKVPSERERQILNMWPRFEDGECVWLGDKYEDNEGNECFASGVYLDIDGPSLVDSEGFHDMYRKGKCVKRLAPKVLDADGVEIKVGDSMYVANNGDGPYIVCDIDENIDRIELFWHENRNEKLFIAANRLTHTRPDSWERFVEDLQKSACTYFGYQHKSCDEGDGCPARGPLDCRDCRTADLVRRANALAGVEVSE